MHAVDVPWAEAPCGGRALGILPTYYCFCAPLALLRVSAACQSKLICGAACESMRPACGLEGLPRR